jgi:hypothetical protein
VTIASAAFGFAALFLLALSFLVAVELPYGEWDAMAFGTWSRAIAAHFPHFHFAFAGSSDYHRPLFYVLQGFVWWVFGFHPALGRLLSLAFSVTLLAGVATLAACTTRVNRRLAASLAVVLVLLIAPFERYSSAGLSDIPVAAMLALTGALLVVPRLGRARLPLLGVAAALSVLAKPSALPSLLGLGLAVLLGPRADLRRRTYAVGALVVGTGIGLVYDLTQASYTHARLGSFLTTGTDGFYANLAAQARHDALLSVRWFGPTLHALLVFALSYALLRLLLAHRAAVAAAFPITLVWAWLGPHLAGDTGVITPALGASNLVEQLAILLILASLLLGVQAPTGAVAGRLQLVRALVWIAPSFVAWALRAVYDVRLLSPAWPPLILLMVWATFPALAGAQARRAWLLLVPSVALVVLCAYAVNNINGLGRSGWRQLNSAGISGLTDPRLMRNVAFGGDFDAELTALEPQVSASDRILTFDQRIRYFYLDQVDFAAPLSCDQLQGRRLFVLLEDNELQQQYGNRAQSSFWEACPNAKLTKVAENPGAFAIFVNGPVAQTVGGCGVPPPTGQLEVDFGTPHRTEAAAQPLLKRVRALGFVQTQIKQRGCAWYSVTETGIPSKEVGQSILDEARPTGVPVQLVTG